MISSVIAVVLFELRRSLTIPRLALWMMLAFMAPALMLPGRIMSGPTLPTEIAGLIAYALIPQVSCMLGLLLWATPTIQSEMEGQTWIYITMRPHGRTAIILGKYLVAVLWTASACMIASVAFPILATDKPWGLIFTLLRLTWLACIGYGAIYVLIGVLFIRRSTIIAFGYTLAIEFGLSWIPATINELTISFRLRSLTIRWMKLEQFDLRFLESFSSQQSTWMLILTLLGMSAGFLGAALFFVKKREIPMQADS